MLHMAMPACNNATPQQSIATKISSVMLHDIVSTPACNNATPQQSCIAIACRQDYCNAIHVAIVPARNNATLQQSYMLHVDSIAWLQQCNAATVL